MWQYNYTDELYHFGVKGMKWGKRKKLEPYKQDLGGGVSAIWPSKKQFKKAEKERVKRDKQQIKSDVKEYRKIHNQLSKAVNNMATGRKIDENKKLALDASMKISEFTTSKRVTKGKYYVDDIIKRSEKIDRVQAWAALGSLAGVGVGAAYIMSKYGLE